MDEQLNRKLVERITETLPPNTNLANYIMKILGVSKEAAYRRIRGDVSFALEEIIKIVSRLNISLDSIIGNTAITDASINMGLIKSPDMLLNYNELLERYIKIFDTLITNPNHPVTIYCATNMLPFYFYATKENILKFRASRWLHQTNRLKSNLSLKEHIPQSFIDLHKKISNKLRFIPKIIYIWDSKIILSLVEEVKYFANLKLISEEDVRQIKKELLEILKSLDNLLSNGIHEKRNEIEIYLSNVSIETTYLYMETDRFHTSMIRIFAINIIDTQHKNICTIQKNWIDSLKRYSTLITHSNEVERIAFINKQYEYIKLL